jgi:hypothetical protein
MPPSERIAVRSTELPYGHLPIRGSVSGVNLVPLRTHPTRGSVTLVHQLLVALASVMPINVTRLSGPTDALRQRQSLHRSTQRGSDRVLRECRYRFDVVVGSVIITLL